MRYFGVSSPISKLSRVKEKCYIIAHIDNANVYERGGTVKFKALKNKKQNKTKQNKINKKRKRANISKINSKFSIPLQQNAQPHPHHANVLILKRMKEKIW